MNKPDGWQASRTHSYPALCLLHGRVAPAWTVDDLALADRFNRLIGEPRKRYLARWRAHNGHLHQGEVIARLENLSAAIMTDPSSIKTRGYIDKVRDHIAGEVERKPS